jgi:hypothetical protein
MLSYGLPVDYDISLLSDANSSIHLNVNAPFSFIRTFLNCEGGFDSEERMIDLVQALIDKQQILDALNYVIKRELLTNKIGILREESVGANLMKIYWFHFHGREYLKKIIR